MIHLFLGALFLSYDAVQGWNGSLIEAVTDCSMKCAIVVSCSDKNQKMLWHPTYDVQYLSHYLQGFIFASLCRSTVCMIFLNDKMKSTKFFVQSKPSSISLGRHIFWITTWFCFWFCQSVARHWKQSHVPHISHPELFKIWTNCYNVQTALVKHVLIW